MHSLIDLPIRPWTWDVGLLRDACAGADEPAIAYCADDTRGLVITARLVFGRPELAVVHAVQAALVLRSAGFELARPATVYVAEPSHRRAVRAVLGEPVRVALRKRAPSRRLRRKVLARARREAGMWDEQPSAWARC